MTLVIIQKLIVKNVRNLNFIEVNPSLHNWFIGENGAGKTNILEAVQLACSSRSFRSLKSRDYINWHAKECVLFAELLSYSKKCISLAVSKSIDGAVILKMNGELVSSASQVAEILPVQVIVPDTSHLIDSGPSYRRKFIDWGVFHVEHKFADYWKTFNKLLRQRNTLLKQKKLEIKLLAVWDKAYVDFAVKLDQARRAYMEGFLTFLETKQYDLLFGKPIVFEFYSGWPTEMSLESMLKKSYDADKHKGLTHYGPHRSDLKIHSNGRNIQQCFSRGQKKLLYVWLKLMQVEYLQQKMARACVCLLDDLVAELDIKHRKFIYNILQKLDVQVFATAVEPDPILDKLNNSDIQMFHVKQGELVPLAKHSGIKPVQAVV